jgi:hypothetical protein
MTEARYVSAAELYPCITVWVCARAYWRRARIVRVFRTHVEVIFRLASTSRLVRQRVPLAAVRLATWEPPLLLRLDVSAPTLDEARAADLLP